MTAHARPEGLRQRNLFTLAAICLLAVTFVFFRNQTGVWWFMWRDAPPLALALALAAGACIAKAWRTRV
jgi:hypothetical protein